VEERKTLQTFRTTMTAHYYFFPGVAFCFHNIIHHLGQTLFSSIGPSASSSASLEEASPCHSVIYPTNQEDPPASL